MKRFFFFPRLAWEGIRKNKRLYIPYLLSCAGMVMMYYILHALSCSPTVLNMRGGSNVGQFLSIGKFVLAAFSLLFLFYTHSFLTRRRYREFGLYSILGMDRRGIGRVVLWESLMTACISLLVGMGLGVLFSKLAELGLINAIHGEIDYGFRISPEAVKTTPIIFCVIFFLLTLRSLLKVRKSRPLELLRSEQAGEKPPKANYMLAILGLLLLGAAYWSSLSIQSPMTALLLFFAAVIMVIIATYLLFISGSVTLCRMLQKNKRYYYQKQHFVSVSSMAFRMKRNGAGLASICILATMVLVMIASTSSLYFGADDALRSRFPLDTQIEIHQYKADEMSEDTVKAVRAKYEEAAKAFDFVPDEAREYRYASITGMMSKSDVNVDSSDIDSSLLDYDRLRTLYFVSVTDHNKLMGTEETVNPGEALVWPVRCEYDRDTISMGGVTLRVAGKPEKAMPIAEAYSTVIPALIILIPDLETLRPMEALIDSTGTPMLDYRWYYGYNWNGALSDEDATALFHAQCDAVRDTDMKAKLVTANTGCIAEERYDFYSTFGGLFFLGIILSAVFLFAAVVIIYYKQISEGYEDQKRFSIMRKVGMTGRDIKKSINSQVLTVFFAPLLFAGMHLAFAFPFVWKLLQLFNLRNLPLVIWISVIAFFVFGILYLCIYKLTAGAYYRIVSSSENE